MVLHLTLHIFIMKIKGYKKLKKLLLTNKNNQRLYNNIVFILSFIDFISLFEFWLQSSLHSGSE